MFDFILVFICPLDEQIILVVLLLSRRSRLLLRCLEVNIIVKDAVLVLS